MLIATKHRICSMYMYSLISLYLGGKTHGREIRRERNVKTTKPQRNNATTTDGLKGRRPICATYLFDQFKKGCIGFYNVLKLGVHCQTYSCLFLYSVVSTWYTGVIFVTCPELMHPCTLHALSLHRFSYWHPTSWLGRLNGHVNDHSMRFGFWCIGGLLIASLF